MPSQDTGRFQLRFTTPVGTSIDVTDAALKQIEGFMAGRPEVGGTFAFVGGFGGGEVNTGMVMITLKEPKDRPKDPQAGDRRWSLAVSTHRNGELLLVLFCFACIGWVAWQTWF